MNIIVKTIVLHIVLLLQTIKKSISLIIMNTFHIYDYDKNEKILKFFVETMSWLSVAGLGELVVASCMSLFSVMPEAGV